MTQPMTDKMVKDLNTMREAARVGELGTRIKNLEDSNPGSVLIPSVAGVTEASKLVLLGTYKEIDTITVAVGGFRIGAGAGAPVLNTAAELNTLAGVTPGVRAPSKAIVLDGDSAIDYWAIKNNLWAGTAEIYSVEVTSTIKMGNISDSDDTSGVTLNGSRSTLVSLNGDTGGVALTVDAASSTSRLLLGTAITSGASIDTRGARGYLKSIVSVSVAGQQGGVEGEYATEGTLTLTGTINSTKSGVTSKLNLGGGATIATNTVVSAYGVEPATFGTTMNGRSAVIHVTNPTAGTWDSLLDLSSATGCTQDSAAGAVGGKFLKVYLNGVLYTIAMVTSA